MMQADCIAHGVPGPVLRYETVGLWVEFENRIPEETALEGTEKPTEKHIGKTGVKIIQVMRENPDVTIDDLAEKLSRSTSAIEKQIAKLKDLEVIQRVGPDKGGHWEVLE